MGQDHKSNPSPLPTSRSMFRQPPSHGYLGKTPPSFIYLFHMARTIWSGGVSSPGRVPCQRLPQLQPARWGKQSEKSEAAVTLGKRCSATAKTLLCETTTSNSAPSGLLCRKLTPSQADPPYLRQNHCYENTAARPRKTDEILQLCSKTSAIFFPFVH